ncbi:hypothetical protein OA57_07750 [Chelonobacter oris]|uniref:HTH araC/xylS-type domain-containing protein n=1 Tax=Chelonobacter oris TaxID=505317 RepID=A0A0A3B9I3_9PAST|nr:HTH-type transcriptional activator RhaS [Chelonobacter oris]KGQ70214.1 hypothetical protein OA57_07750 [Chelonobacter oris]
MVQKLYDSDFFIAKKQSIKVEPRIPQQNYPEHTHNFDEIVIVTKGKGRHILNGYPHELYQGMILYIEAKDHHLYENVQDLHLTNILLRSCDSFQFLNNIRFLLLSIKPQQSCYQVLHKKHAPFVFSLVDKLKSQSLESIPQQESLFFQLLSLLQQYQYDDKGIGSTEEKGRQLLRWLAYHFNEKIDWEEIAQQFSLPIRTLHRYIRNSTGYSPQHYISKLRLAEAYYQLRYTDKNIITIAYDCGFNDGSYFSTCFKNEFMISPRDVRNV